METETRGCACNRVQTFGFTQPGPTGDLASERAPKIQKSVQSTRSCSLYIGLSVPFCKAYELQSKGSAANIIVMLVVRSDTHRWTAGRSVAQTAAKLPSANARQCRKHDHTSKTPPLLSPRWRSPPKGAGWENAHFMDHECAKGNIFSVSVALNMLQLLRSPCMDRHVRPPSRIRLPLKS